MFACLGVAALIIGIILEVIGRKKHFGLELPNIFADDTPENVEDEVV